MLNIRKANQRGITNIGWLNSAHTFSFGDYYDPHAMGFRSLRVVNDDIVAGGQGFGTHPHRDMEIISYVVEGSLQHKDSMGNGSVIVPGDVQRMSAGTGVRHSEFNPSPKDAVRFLQIWILPEKNGTPPSYEQKHFTEEDRHNQLRVVASSDGRNGSVKVHQDVALMAGILDAGHSVEHSPAKDRYTFLQVVKGDVDVNGQKLTRGDSAQVDRGESVTVKASSPAELLVFDLA